MRKELERAIERMWMLGWISIFCALLVVAISFYISDYVVRTINVMSVSASDIIRTGDLSRRIEIDTHWDDLSFLSHVLNDMLWRIEDLMKGVKRVSDNIAHDLRTPLTRLRTRLDDIKAGEVISDEDREHLIKDADVLLSMFNGLLRIARIESIKEQSFKPTCLRDLVNAVAEYYEPLAEVRGVGFEVEAEPFDFVCDRDLLFQAIANVLDNAIKFTPEGGEVWVKVLPKKDEVRVEVIDSGPGIQDDDFERVFRRFYRGDKSRNTPGFGLGLSLVSAIVNLHQGTIELENRSPGLSLSMRFPIQMATVQ
jgi:signal transduction histidine kinase